MTRWRVTKDGLLETLRGWRRDVIAVLEKERPTSALYKRCLALNKAIDGVAEEITGDPEHFHLKGHGGGRG